ncbi:hypothetical protein KGV55_00725 [Candidatus Gracilibacteria bacterium]|nr:hypothetical protein [Candidatus Gracilibacteria bacterium]
MKYFSLLLCATLLVSSCNLQNGDPKTSSEPALNLIGGGQMGSTGTQNETPKSQTGNTEKPQNDSTGSTENLEPKIDEKEIKQEIKEIEGMIDTLEKEVSVEVKK